MARVLVTRRLPDGGLDPLALAGHELVLRVEDEPLTHAQLVEAAAEVDAIVCLLTDRIDRNVLEAGAGRLRVVANVAVGAGAQHCRVDRVGEERHHRVDVTRVRAQLVVRVRPVVGIRTDELVRGERFQPAVGKTAGDEHPSHAVRTSARCS